MLNNALSSLEGEDICVCVGACPDDYLPFFVKRIAENGASVVVVLYVEGMLAEGRAEAESLVLKLKRHLPPMSLPMRYVTMDLEKWNAFFGKHQDEAFGIFFLQGNEHLPMPLGPVVAKSPRSETVFAAFDDIPNFKDQLWHVVEALSGKAVDGMWPTVLLTGETGSGKSFTAERIHEALKRACGMAGEFVHLNCGEFSSEDMNSALFGFDADKFSVQAKGVQQGAIERANGGLLFLDEIGTLPVELQPRLLTLLDKGVFRRHGTTIFERANCRFIFGTNEALDDAVREGRFRFDLYNRINGMRLKLPSVRNRVDGVSGMDFLARQLAEFCRKHGDVKVTALAKSRFLDFARSRLWRGNFRELMSFFQLLLRKVERPSVISAQTVSKAITQFSDEVMDERAFAVETTEKDVSVNHPLLEGREGFGANEKVELVFAFRCAARAANCNAAGRLFFAGKTFTSKNWNTSFERFLARNGYCWDADVEGHVRRKNDDVV